MAAPVCIFTRLAPRHSEAVKKLIVEILDFTKQSPSLAGAAEICDRTKLSEQATPGLWFATKLMFSCFQFILSICV
jgi:hypothetical protein